MVANSSSLKYPPLAGSAKALSLLNQGDYKAALACFEEGRQAGQNLDNLINQAVCLIHLELAQEALEMCDRAIALDPTHSQAWLFKGVACHRLGRHKEAYACYDKALEEDSAEETPLVGTKFHPVRAFKRFIKRLGNSSLLRLWVH